MSERFGKLSDRNKKGSDEFVEALVAEPVIVGNNSHIDTFDLVVIREINNRWSNSIAYTCEAAKKNVQLKLQI